MRQVFYPEPYKLQARDLDIESSITKQRGSVFTGVTEAIQADNDVLMITTTKEVNIKIGDTLHKLAIEDNEIKFKEIK